MPTSPTDRGEARNTFRVRQRISARHLNRKLPFTVVPDIILIAFAFSATVGVAFGFLPARKAMMQQWADYLDKIKAGAEIVPLRRA